MWFWRFFLLMLCAAPAWAAHGMGMGYAPKYPASFPHFDYVNPQAPKGGRLTLSAEGSFDKLNPFTLRGRIAAGMGHSSSGFVFAEYGLVFDALTTASEDEPFSRYGLLAEDIELAADSLSVTFRLRPQARFSNGDPVLALDVKHSFDTLMSRQASPVFRSYWADVKRAVVLAERSIRFEFRRRNSELHMILGQLPVFSHRWGGGKPFDQMQNDAPIASGPYVIRRLDLGKSIVYARRADYWAAGLPVRRGMFNFDEVHYQYYRDALGQEEALKVGDIDAMEETGINAWVRKYRGRRFDSGEIVKLEVAHQLGTGMQGLALNLRRPQFADRRVRQALDLAFDFDWLNQRIFYGRRARTQSYFNNHPDLMAQPEISAQERALIDSLTQRQAYWRGVQGPLPRAMGTGATAQGLRANLRQAAQLLADAGWVLRDGALRDAQGQPFIIRLDFSDRSSEVVLAPYARNLMRLGIALQYRLVDASLLKKRRDAFDFDLAVAILGGSSSPGNELYDDFGSQSAKEPGGQNLPGIADPVVDELVERIVGSADRSAIAAGARALDRYLLHQYYVVPMYFGKQFFVAHQKHLRHPDTLPPHLLASSWLLTMWWSGSTP
ncbi:ABC transporter substrate-binding protein [Verminephrobacter aporrectodeae subsp. tuberculatae]|nr:ABC transporter substrate-binding protein [Verminephrobacter aporrectodeae subsp. tuberculatae]